MRNLGGISEKASSLLGPVAIAALTPIWTFLVGYWIYYPVGADKYEHLTITKYILDNWPNSSWHYIWAAGNPFHLWYAPLMHHIMALFVYVTRFSIGFSLMFMALTAYCVVAVALYYSVLEITGSRLSSIMSSVLALSSPVFWAYWQGGYYPRTLSLMFLSLATLLVIRYVKNTRSNTLYFLSVLVAAASIQSHLGALILTPLSILFVVFLCVRGLRSRIAFALKLLLPSFLISGHYLIPFILSGPTSHIRWIGRFGMNYQDFFLPSIWMWNPSPVLFVPLAICLIIPFVRRSFIRTDSHRWRLVAAFGLMSAVMLFLGTALFFGYEANVDMVLPPGLIFTAFHTFYYFLFLICGAIVGLGVASKRVVTGELARPITRFRLRASAILMLIVVTASLMTNLILDKRLTAWVRWSPYPFVMPHPILLNIEPGRVSPQWQLSTSVDILRPSPDPALEVVQQLMKGNEDERMYRFGTIDAGVAGWFNYLYSVPQTRDYELTVIVYPNWRAWLDTAVWARVNNYEETNYLLDWYAVKWFIAAPVEIRIGTKVTLGPSNYEKFLSRPRDYRVVAVSGDNRVYGFTYKHSTPIASATNTPTLLIVGKEGVAYEEVFRTIAHLGYGSHYIIPVRGRAYIDDYTLEELSGFDAIVLYKYQYHNQAKAWSLLDKYVKGGGGLLIETTNSPDESASLIPSPSPVEATKKTDFGEKWHFSFIEHEVTREIDFSSFSPAIYNETGVLTPWGVSASYNSSVRTWARTVLWDQGFPVVAAGRLDKGFVVWSGLNLFARVASYRNLVESLFLSKVIDWISMAPAKRTVKVDYEAQQVTAERIRVSIRSPSAGVLLKESCFENWRAYLLDARGMRRDLPILRAGPDFMFVQVRSSDVLPIQIFFEYGRSWEEWLGYSTSAISFTVLLILCLRPSTFSRLGHLQMRLGKFKKRLDEWWREEE